MNHGSLSMAMLLEAGLGAYFHPRDLVPLGITFRRLQALVERRVVERVGRGLYRLQSVAPDPDETAARVAAACPRGILCLLTALRMHGLGTQTPRDVWLAVGRKDRPPVLPGVSLRLFRFSGPMAIHGIRERRLLGVPVKVTSPARTVVDCFRYRNKIGIDVALEALGDALKRRIVTADEILRIAEKCRASSVIRPYLEAMVA